MKTIWSSRGDIDNILDLPVDQKRLELTNWYDQEMVDQLADDELDKVIADNVDEFYNEAMEDFEYRVAPMIANQFLGGFVLDENFNLVDPGVLLNDAKYDCEIYEDDNGDLYWKEEGRKAFPILGFAEDQDEFIDQLDKLDILSTMHNLYPDQDDEDIEVYDIADLIPFDWTLLEGVLDHAKNDLMVKEELTEAKAKNPNKLADELEEIKDLADEYGYEYFTQMPFTSFDNDPISIEVQYPEFFRVVKAFFKEMGILSAEELNNSDILDMSWDQDISQHDWDVFIRACDKLAQGKGVQFEKEYKTGYNSVLDDNEILANREQEESLNEAVEIHMEGTYDMADLLDAYDNKTGKVHDNLEFIKNLSKNKHLYKDDEGIEFIVTDDGVYDDLDENLNEDVRFYVDGRDVVDSLKDDRAIGTLYDDGTVELFDAKSVSKADRERIKKDLSNHYYVSFLDEDLINPELYKPFGHDSYDSGYIHEPELPDWWDPEEDEARILPPDADDEDWEDDLDEDISEYQDVYMLVDADGNDLYGVDTKEEAKDELKFNPEAVGILHKRMDDSFRFEDPNFEPVPVDLDEDSIDSLKEDTVTWPWGNPEDELPKKKAAKQVDTSDIDKYL